MFQLDWVTWTEQHVATRITYNQ